MTSTDTLSINRNETNLLHTADIDVDKHPTDKNNQIIFNNPIDKLNIIGAQFELTQNCNLGQKRFTDTITRKAQEIQEKIESYVSQNITVTHFSETNPGFNSSQQSHPNFFIATHALSKILSHTNNKKSAAIDGILNTIIRKLPGKFIHAIAASQPCNPYAQARPHTIRDV